MTIGQLKRLLESNNVMVHDMVLANMFNKVDADGSGTINLMNSKSTRRGYFVIQNWSKRYQFSKSSFRSIGFWGAMCYLFGSIFTLGPDVIWKKGDLSLGEYLHHHVSALHHGGVRVFTRSSKP